MSAATATKKTTKKSETAPATKTVEVKAEVKIEPVKAAKKAAEPKVEKKAEVKKEEPKEEKKTRAKKEAAPKAEVAAAEPAEPAAPRAAPTSESVQTDVLNLIASLATAKLGELENQKQAIKLLKSTASTLKRLRNDLTRVLKKTKRERAPKDSSKLSNSGLMKPVAISKDLAQFMSVDPESLHSRVSVTNAICNYIKEKNLQNASNKREITPDANLAKLLNYKAGAQPLTYFYIQQLIQPHFLKEISSDLAQFMGVSASSKQSTSSVLSSVLSYCTSKGLIHGQEVHLDDKLGKLVGKTGNVTVQAMNQLVKAHFKK